MYKYERCLLAYLLVDRLNEVTNCNYGIRSRIHVLCSLEPGSINDDLRLNNSKNIAIDHAARAARSNYRFHSIQNLQINVNGNTLMLNYQLLTGNQTIQRDIQLCGIPEALDNHEVLNQKGFNTSPQEREYFWHLLKQLGTNEDIHPKIEAFHQLLTAIANNQAIVERIVNMENPDTGDRFLQTILGAGIFYLPQNNEIHWTGKISIEALWNLVNFEIRPTKDHILPRRRGASQLMQVYKDSDMNPALLSEYYNENLAPYNLLTAAENTRLINYFFHHNNYDEALQANGITLFPPKNRFLNNQQFNNFVDLLRQNPPYDINDMYTRWEEFVGE